MPRPLAVMLINEPEPFGSSDIIRNKYSEHISLNKTNGVLTKIYKSHMENKLPSP